MTTDPMHVKLRSPHPGEWIRVNPDPEHRQEVMLIVEHGQTYMIAENMVEHVNKVAPDRMERKMLFVAQNRDGETFLWPVAVPVAKNHIAYRAMDKWICFPTMH